jgi:two-component system, OmpR family, catabolic regulation response regulator CreB
MEKLIVIVEDELAIADTIAYALRTDGFVPQHFGLGQLALDALRAGAPAQLVVLDVGLPDMSGLEVCRQLRQFSDVPVIFLTARSDEIDRVVGLEIGADDYVTKPFSPRELVARIRVILRRVAAVAPSLAGSTGSIASMGAALPGSGSSSRQGMQQFELRAGQARIVYRGALLDLTRYEYLLLKTLIEHPGHVLSRAQLMDRVWQDAPDTSDRTVDTHVKSLRAKLKAIDQAQQVPSQEWIQTHRSMGYSLSLD